MHTVCGHSFCFLNVIVFYQILSKKVCCSSYTRLATEVLLDSQPKVKE
ncbi:hypothetical protein GLYMA_20G190651v4 [Glycine max]|nr:hypothetical protein GLYMA_20G190651v4 [Glycine max]KAH1036886.1 hypothetical protein GYH30_056353 [Glycine max]